MGRWTAAWHPRNWTRKLWIAVALVFALSGGVVYWAQDFVRRRLPGYLATRLSQALHRPVRVSRVSFWPIGAFSMRHFVVLPGPGETAPPLTADRIRSYISWWDLLAHRQLHVRAVHVDDAHLAATVDLSKPEIPHVNPAAQLLSFYGVGLRQVGLHNTTADVMTVLRDGSRQPVTAKGLEFVADLKPASFRYRARAAEWQSGGLTARKILLAGSADPERIVIRRSRAEVQGGRLAANGVYVSKPGDVNLRVQVREMPLQSLAPQMGLPAGWNVQGNLTGQIEVSAASGALEKATGTLRLSPGSISRPSASLPWTSATGRVEWTPDSVSLQNVDVRGQDIRLLGSASAAGSASTPLAARPFRAQGTVEATSKATVARLATLLAFSSPVGERWDVKRGSLAFQANGIVGRVKDSTASGRFQATGFMVRPRTKGNPLVFRTVSGEIRRTPSELTVHGLEAVAEGVTARGNLSLTPNQIPRLGQYAVNGSIDLTNFVTLQQQLPDVPVWKWIGTSGPSAHGTVTFNAHGPTAFPERAEGTGEFRFREFAASVPDGPKEQRWTFPVRTLSGGMRLAHDHLALTDLTLRSDLFRAMGAGTVHAVSQGGNVSGRLRAVSEHWAQLPPLQGRIPKGLSGGTLVVEGFVPPHQEGDHAAHAGPGIAGALPPHTPTAGTITLLGASYETTVAGKAKRVQLQEASASLRLAGDRWLIPRYVVVTPQFRTSGSGYAAAAANGRVGERESGGPGASWDLHGNGVLTTSDAGALLQWATGRQDVKGGALTARYAATVPGGNANRASGTARVRLTNAQPILPPGALPFAPSESRIDSLTGTFGYAEGVLAFRNAVWVAPSFRGTGSGSSDGKTFDGNVRLTTDKWGRLAGDLARSLPVTGGLLTVEGRLRGPVDRLREAPLNGTVELREAHLVPRGSIHEGTLDLKTAVQGTLAKLSAASLDGRFSLRNLVLVPLRPNAQALRVNYAEGHYRRTGNRVNVTDLSADLPGDRLTGQGTLYDFGTKRASHAFNLKAEGPALAKLLPAIAPVPGKASGGRFTATLRLSGTLADPTYQAEGRAEIVDAEWTPPGQTVSVPIERMAAHFVRKGQTATLDNTELRVKGGVATLSGTASGLGTRAGERHDLRLSWRLENASSWASRFFPVPGWFTGGLFTGNASVTGNAKTAAETASGKFELANTGFLPPQKFLGGPERPINVSSARGLFRRSRGRTELTDLDLNSSVGTATGTVTADDRGNAQIQARAVIRKLQPLIDLWPGFTDRVKGGSGEITLSLHGPLRHPRNLEGPVEIVGRGGVLTVANVPDEYSTEPFDELSTRLTLHPGGQVELRDVTMRGPKANLDAHGVVTGDRRVHAKGKAWFSEKFTRSLIKPKILRPVAKLFGFKKLKSDFTLDGTLDRAALEMSITHTTLWKVAVKKRVPEPLRRIATGEAPIWGPAIQEPSRKKTRIAAGRAREARTAFR